MKLSLGWLNEFRVGRVMRCRAIAVQLVLMMVGMAVPASSAGTAQPGAGTSGTVSIRIEHWFGRQPVVLHEGDVVTSDGVRLQFTRLDYLVSGVRLQSTDGHWSEFPDQYFFVSQGEERMELQLRGVPQGVAWSNLEFMIGLSPQVNQMPENAWPSGHALNALTNNLRWTWAGGSVFLALEGYSVPASGIRRPFLYHVGADQNLMRVRVSLGEIRDFSAVRLCADFSRLCGDGMLGSKMPEVTHSAAEDRFASMLARAVETCFFVREAGR